MAVRPAKTQISLGIHPVWSESSLSAWRNLGSLDTHWAYSEDSGQTGRMPRLIWVFTGRTLILLVLSCRGSNVKRKYKYSSHHQKRTRWMLLWQVAYVSCLCFLVSVLYILYFTNHGRNVIVVTITHLRACKVFLCVWHMGPSIFFYDT